jgi:hypothetical protein
MNIKAIRFNIAKFHIKNGTIKFLPYIFVDTNYRQNLIIETMNHIDKKAYNKNPNEIDKLDETDKYYETDKFDKLYKFLKETWPGALTAILSNGKFQSIIIIQLKLKFGATIAPQDIIDRGSSIFAIEKIPIKKLNNEELLDAINKYIPVYPNLISRVFKKYDKLYEYSFCPLVGYKRIEQKLILKYRNDVINKIYMSMNSNDLLLYYVTMKDTKNSDNIKMLKVLLNAKSIVPTARLLIGFGLSIEFND